MITPDHLADLEAKARAASPRPWSFDSAPVFGGDYKFDTYEIFGANAKALCDMMNCDACVSEIYEECDEEGVHRWDEQSRRNAAYIVAACNAVPDLIAALRASEAREKDLVEAIKAMMPGDANMDKILWGRLPDTATGTSAFTLGDHRKLRRLLADRETGEKHDG